MTVYVGLESLYSADVGIGVPRLFDYGVRARTLWWASVAVSIGVIWRHPGWPWTRPWRGCAGLLLETVITSGSHAKPSRLLTY